MLSSEADQTVPVRCLSHEQPQNAASPNAGPVWTWQPYQGEILLFSQARLPSNHALNPINLDRCKLQDEGETGTPAPSPSLACACLSMGIATTQVTCVTCFFGHRGRNFHHHLHPGARHPGLRPPGHASIPVAGGSAQAQRTAPAGCHESRAGKVRPAEHAGFALPASPSAAPSHTRVPLQPHGPGRSDTQADLYGSVLTISCWLITS